jgi:hypothetical protein
MEEEGLSLETKAILGRQRSREDNAKLDFAGDRF